MTVDLREQSGPVEGCPTVPAATRRGMTRDNDPVVSWIYDIHVPFGHSSEEGEDNSFLGQPSEHLSIKRFVFVPVVR
jgi:hypothetical protein